MMNKIIYILITALTLVACKKNPMSEPDSGEVKILINAQKIDVNPLNSATKAVSNNGFAEGNVLGLYSQVNDGDQKELLNVKDENFGYVYRLEKLFLDPVDKNKVIYLEPLKKISIYGYYPYSEVSENVTVSKSGDRMITYALKTQQNTQEDLLKNDLMFAKCDGVFQTTPVVSLGFKHVLSKVTFVISKGSNWTENIELEQVNLVGKNIPVIGRMRLFDGTIVADKPSDANKLITAKVNTRIVENAGVEVDFLLIPFNSIDTNVELVANGIKYVATLPSIEFASAKNIIFKIKLNNYNDNPIELSPEIVDWEVTQVVDINPT